MVMNLAAELSTLLEKLLSDDEDALNLPSS